MLSKLHEAFLISPSAPQAGLSSKQGCFLFVCLFTVCSVVLPPEVANLQKRKCRAQRLFPGWLETLGVCRKTGRAGGVLVGLQVGGKAGSNRKREKWSLMRRQPTRVVRWLAHLHQTSRVISGLGHRASFAKRVIPGFSDSPALGRSSIICISSRPVASLSMPPPRCLSWQTHCVF